MQGLTFGRLTVLARAEDRGTGRKRLYWLCRCTCGVEKTIREDGLKAGLVVSCGCKKKTHGLKHGLRKTGLSDPTYQTWNGMIQRCTNPKCDSFKDYGGRGIGLPEEWKIFDNFLRDMGPRPAGLTLERKENNEGYSKGNCYWATKREQSRNKRNTNWVEYNGEMMCLSDAATQSGLNRGTLFFRFKTNPKDPELFNLNDRRYKCKVKL